jgi:diguanylate cyclase (GGDEF)-like protein
VSLTAQGETLGVLHLRHLPPAGEPAVPSAEWLAGREQLARTLADSLALALANLRLREHLHDQSIRDPLTGLYNRRYLQETLGRELHRAARERQPVGLVVFDIDHFKSFNDSLGHEAGDHVLREFGHLLLAYTRGQDVACRLGGEEFVLLLPGAPLAVTLARAELIRQAVAAHETLYRGLPIPRLTVSAGVAAYPEHQVSGDPLLRAADQALYEAKAAGRNCVRVAGPDSVSGLTALQE